MFLLTPILDNIVIKIHRGVIMQQEWKNYILLNSKAIVLSDGHKYGLLKKIEAIQHNDKIIIYMDKKEDPCFVACGGRVVCKQTIKVGYFFIKKLFARYYSLNGLSTDDFLELWHSKGNFSAKVIKLIEDNIETFYKCDRAVPNYDLLTSILLKAIDEVLEDLNLPTMPEKTIWFKQLLKWGK